MTMRSTGVLFQPGASGISGSLVARGFANLCKGVKFRTEQLTSCDCHITHQHSTIDIQHLASMEATHAGVSSKHVKGQHRELYMRMDPVPWQPLVLGESKEHLGGDPFVGIDCCPEFEQGWQPVIARPG